MRNDYFDTDEFKSVLEKYEASEEQGTACYFDAENFVDIADYYLLSDRPEDAVRVLDHGLSLHSGDEDLLSTKSGAYIYMHQYDEARQLLDTLDADDANVIYQQAQLAYAIDKDVERAEELFSEWIEREETDSRFDDEEVRGDRIRDAYLHVMTSFIELAGGSYDDEVLKRWIEEYYARFAPLGKFDCDLMLADMVRNEGLTDMVEKVYSSILEHDPYINYGWTVLSASQVMNGKYNEALDSAEFALAINPDDLDAKLNKAHAYYALGHKDKALPLFEDYIKQTGDPNQYLPYAISLITSDRVAEAEIFLARTEEHLAQRKADKDYYAQTCFELSEAYLGVVNLHKADEYITKALEVYPNDVEFLLVAGTIRLIMDDMERCVATFTKCIDVAEDKAGIMCRVAFSFIVHEQVDTGLQLLDHVKSFATDSPSYRMLSAYYAVAYLQMGRMEEFLVNLKQACNECPDILRSMFFGRFPDSLDPKDYYDFIINNPLNS